MTSVTKSLRLLSSTGSAPARYYSQAATSASGTGALRSPRRTLPSPATCTCGSLSLALLPLHLYPLQSRRGAARSSKRSPTVRRNERQQQPAGPRGTETAAPSAFVSERIFPSDTTVVAPALDAAISEQGSTLTRDECLEVLENVRRIVQDKIKITEASLLQGRSGPKSSFGGQPTPVLATQLTARVQHHAVQNAHRSHAPLVCKR